MASLGNIRNKIQTIKTINKVTNAMKLVSTARIQKMRKKFLAAANYMNSIYELLTNLLTDTNIDKLMKKKNAPNKNLYILISSSQGLCGSFNLNIVNYLINEVNKNDEIITIGNIGKTLLISKGLEKQVIKSINFASKEIDHLELLPISIFISNNFKNNQYANIYIIYTKYINPLKFIPVKLQVLPFDKNLFDSTNNPIYTKQTNAQGQIVEYDTNKLSLINNIINFLISSFIFMCYMESKICEHCSRKNAMEAASDSANNIITDLKIQYNSERQNKITQEITEIIAGINVEM